MLALSIVALASATWSAGPAGAAEPPAVALLAQVKAAAGGERWDGVEVILAQGEKSRFGLTGPYASTEDLATGRFVRRADYGLFANAEGLDEAGRWRMDNSGGVHPLDSDEAKAVAVTEAYLAARGYLFPQRAKAAIALQAPAAEAGQVFDRIVATPEGGRAVVLWIRRSDSRLDRATIELGSRLETIRYADYRAVDGLWLPFNIVTANGDQLDTGAARIARYSLQAASDGEPPHRPAGPRDAAIPSGAPVAHAWFRLDPLSGFPIVAARINGAGPLLFVLDTGGHDILTPAAAKLLGLTLSGSGFGRGAGGGSRPTRFTKVASVAIGEAVMTDQPFTVLQFDLGQAIGPDDQPAAIAGIIGLELFERLTVTMDYAAGRLALSLPGPEPIKGGTPIRFTGDMPLVEASIDGRRGWFGLDTGNNTDVILFKAWVDASGLASWFEVSVDAPGNGVGGAIAFRKGRAEALSLADVELRGLPVLLAGDGMGGLSTRGEAGNIGQGVLSRYTVTFDYAHGRMRLDPPSAPSEGR